jgi:hypothetical protein
MCLLLLVRGGLLTTGIERAGHDIDRIRRTDNLLPDFTSLNRGLPVGKQERKGKTPESILVVDLRKEYKDSFRGEVTDGKVGLTKLIGRVERLIQDLAELFGD